MRAVRPDALGRFSDDPVTTGWPGSGSDALNLGYGFPVIKKPPNIGVFRVPLHSRILPCILSDEIVFANARTRARVNPGFREGFPSGDVSQRWQRLPGNSARTGLQGMIRRPGEGPICQ